MQAKTPLNQPLHSINKQPSRMVSVWHPLEAIATIQTFWRYWTFGSCFFLVRCSPCWSWIGGCWICWSVYPSSYAQYHGKSEWSHEKPADIRIICHIQVLQRRFRPENEQTRGFIDFGRESDGFQGKGMTDKWIDSIPMMGRCLINECTPL